MENEKQETPKEEIKEPIAEQPVSLVEEARLIRDEIIKERERLQEENNKREKLQANELLGSSAGGHVEAKPAVEETSKEYAEKVMKNEIKE